MIYGIGTDIVQIERLAALWQQRPDALAKRLLSPEELAHFETVQDKPRFLAKRFTAKEAFAKAVGTGIRGAVSFRSITIGHDALGKPLFQYNQELADWMQQQSIDHVHLSLADETHTVIAYAIAERL